MSRRYRTVGVVYTARGRDILGWFIRTVFFSVITLGLYLPVAVNELVRYLFDHTELCIGESQVSES
jgi:uncharacterized membrane protein YjgN (DUF898 family)